jgi:1-aminocyclopropane-1-carboxylate deaminase/D-cysteine desulfhydrase-like pyridoxal-dependent ACC family enzyme
LLDGPRIFFKRDDLTGLACGGNKVRMLEFRLVGALQQDADTVIAGYGVQSNHARQIAAACSRLGMECRLILKEEPGSTKSERSRQGNRLLYEILGAKVTLTDAPVIEQIAMMKSLAEDLRKAGRRPYVTGVDDYDLSTIAYADCMLEMCAQFDEQDAFPDTIVVCSDGPTQAGLLVAARYLKMETRIVGIAPMRRIDRPGRCPEIPADIIRLCGLCAERLGIDVDIRPEDVVNVTDYVGEGYGILNGETVEAVRAVGRTEGILLDPVYTGKAMAGLMDMIRRKAIAREETVLFLHTGGYPLLFLYGDELVQ